MYRLVTVGLLGLLLATSVGSAQTLDPNQPYSAKKSHPVTYTVDFRVIITAPMNTKQLRVWIPIPQDDSGQKVSEGKWDIFPTAVQPTFHQESVFGNPFAYFEFANPQGAQIIAHQFQVTVWELNWNVDPAKVTQVETWPTSFTPYRRAEQAIVVDDRFQKLAKEITSGKATQGTEINAVMDWVQDQLTYDHSNTSLIASSEHALTKKRGDCSDYHGLCSSLSRALGQPTRVTYGLHAFAKNLPCHCKLEAFLPPYGWVSFDVSETQRLIQSIKTNKELAAEKKKELIQAATQRLRQGFRDNTWFVVSKGTDYELAPKASKKVPLIATIYAEADGQPLPLPDPADVTKKEFAWMTAHKYVPDQVVPYPFRDWKTLLK